MEAKLAGASLRALRRDWPQRIAMRYSLACGSDRPPTRPGRRLIYASSRCNQGRMRPQSCSTVLADTPRAAAIFAWSSPPKIRISATALQRGSCAPSRSRARSRSRRKPGSGSSAARHSSSGTDAQSPPRLARRRRLAKSLITRCSIVAAMAKNWTRFCHGRRCPIRRKKASSTTAVVCTSASEACERSRRRALARSPRCTRWYSVSGAPGTPACTAASAHVMFPGSWSPWLELVVMEMPVDCADDIGR